MPFIKKHKNEIVRMDEREHERNCAKLIDQLSEPDPAARRWAARDLINCPDDSASLIKRLKIEPDVSVREVIFSTLTCLGDQSSIAGLVDCLRSDNAAIRNEAIEAMKQFPDDVAVIIQELLSDPDSDVRILTVNILESLCHPDVERWLIDVIEKDLHVNVCATALDLLGEVATKTALEPLTRLKSRFSDEPYIQFAVDLALKRIG